MSKKAKGVVLGGFQPMSLDAKSRFKSQTLLIEYQDLQKETSGVRMKLDAAKHRRNELLAEVRFLRKRHRYLLKVKSVECPEVQQSNIEKIQTEPPTKVRNFNKSEATRFKLPPLPKSKPKRKEYAGTASVNISSSLPPLNRTRALQIEKDNAAASQYNLTDVNCRKRISRDNDAAFRDVFHSRMSENLQSGNVTVRRTPTLDLNLDSLVRKEETVLPNRIPTFDLNEVSTEEDEIQVIGGDELGKIEESKKSIIRGGGYDEQTNDMKITSSVCRNNTAGEGGGGGASSSRIGKRKISWQDPVALRV